MPFGLTHLVLFSGENAWTRQKLFFNLSQMHFTSTQYRDSDGHF
jgi:hypothetical protein